MHIYICTISIVTQSTFAPAQIKLFLSDLCMHTAGQRVHVISNTCQTNILWPSCIHICLNCILVTLCKWRKKYMKTIFYTNLNNKIYGRIKQTKLSLVNGIVFMCTRSLRKKIIIFYVLVVIKLTNCSWANAAENKFNYTIWSHYKLLFLVAFC